MGMHCEVREVLMTEIQTLYVGTILALGKATLHLHGNALQKKAIEY